eukprot:CAMPEP_0194763618 /NCGR_PEP_ID=MMETSP0323_2-20130528/20054_1 /TAXON_ID=2866 ORGANISM="Crypthecodinium cohnii, Strain Seligo" /NCGR_SAMPLE_ID=MMETSP0323_2 /ASSEMBLY_ACC=CAM_ASM_000346 /LENGTH=255 /DNA_ID=CAMNT_0039688809 /DNA_START=140 /DNA_END=907 /DNA_ORIENTATION=+
MANRASTIVFGGRGFVGAAVCRELVKRGAGPVVAVGRSSNPGPGGDLGPHVEAKGGIDAFKPESYEKLLESARAVVISVGEAPWAEKVWGSKDQAKKMNGLSNVRILQAAAEAKVPRVILVNATMPQWGLIAGYREGKEMAREEAKRYTEKSGLGDKGCTVLVLKPAVITGTRYVGSIPLPLNLVMGPMRFVMKCLKGPCSWLESTFPSVFGGLLRPAVWVDEMAAAAADVVQSEDLKGLQEMDPDTLVGYQSSK